MNCLNVSFYNETIQLDVDMNDNSSCVKTEWIIIDICRIIILKRIVIDIFGVVTKDMNK